jgi:ring-1,2-phenylacetyl-CoA epoxidase subunit PaaD
VVICDITGVRRLLDEIRDPEIPAISITDLGIVRDVRYAGDSTLEVVLTPTYSGCPATKVIRDDVERALRDHGIERLRIVTQLSPAWTTDWITDRGRARLLEVGITPPSASLADGPVVLHAEIRCPRCGSGQTQETSRFGSTPCKALYRCLICGEPFDYFKEH